MFIFTLSGCADTVPVQTQDHPPQPTVEITLAPPTVPAGPVDSEAISFPAGNTPLAQDSAADKSKQNQKKLELPAEPSSTPVPQTTQASPHHPGPTGHPGTCTPGNPAPARGTIKFDVTTQKRAGESPAPSTTLESDPTPVPPVEIPPPASAEPVFSIDYWIAYA